MLNDRFNKVLLVSYFCRYGNGMSVQGGSSGAPAIGGRNSPLGIYPEPHNQHSNISKSSYLNIKNIN